MWLDDTELLEFERELLTVIQPRLANAPRPGVGSPQAAKVTSAATAAPLDVRIETSRSGSNTRPRHPGDFIHVPAGPVHRELTIESVDATTEMTRSGEGPAMFAVASPDPTQRHSEVTASLVVQLRHPPELLRPRLHVHDPVHTLHALGLRVADDALGR
jgi:hypothetical protein